MMAANTDGVRDQHHSKDNTPEHSLPSANEKNAQEMHRQTPGKARSAPAKHKPAKTSAAYWMGKVKKPAGSSLYGIQIAYRGQRQRFPLETANQAAAAEKARSIYLHLVAHGVDATLEKFNPRASEAKADAPPLASLTIGGLIQAAMRLSSARAESLDTYAKALRRIAVGVFSAQAGSRKWKDTRGSDAWRERVDSIPLSQLTPALVLAWKNGFLKSASNPQERNSAAVTVNSLLRNSKALVSKRIRPFLESEFTLPSPLWFENVPLEKEPSLRYRSAIDAGDILRAATRELATQDPEAFKDLLLTLICGLRRSEADSVQWSQVDLDGGTLEIMDTEHRALKSSDSAGKIALDTEVVAMLRGFKALTGSPFILETPKQTRIDHKSHKSRTYRCNATHLRLMKWLREQGVAGKRPIHTMRKEIGSIIATRDGIFAASRFLRHSDIRITSRLYADAKQLVSSGLGALLTTDKGRVIAGDFQSANEKTIQRATIMPKSRRSPL